MDDEQLQRRMADWDRAEKAARDAERAVGAALHDGWDAVQSPAQHAAHLRRRADAILDSILGDIRVGQRSFIPWVYVSRSPAAGPS